MDFLPLTPEQRQRLLYFSTEAALLPLPHLRLSEVLQLNLAGEHALLFYKAGVGVKRLLRTYGQQGSLIEAAVCDPAQEPNPAMLDKHLLPPTLYVYPIPIWDRDNFWVNLFFRQRMEAMQQVPQGPSDEQQGGSPRDKFLRGALNNE